MKKFVVILVIALLALAILPCATVYAATDEGANLCLINPVAVTAIGNKLFVADNVDEANNQSVILCFDISADKPQSLFTHSVNQPIKNMSNVNGELCVIFENGFSLLELAEDGLTEISSTENVQAADVTFGNWNGTNTQYMLGKKDGQEHLFRWDGANFVNVDSTTTQNPVACTEHNGKIYFLYNETCKRFNGTFFDTADIFNKSNLFVPGGMGIFSYQIENGEETESNVAVYNKKDVYALSETSTICIFNERLLTYNNGIVDLCFGNGKLFVLNELNQVEIFAHTANGWESANQKIGTDVISLNVAEPKDFSGFTLAKSTGYPTNIVYRTEFKNSVSEIKTEYYDEFIILDFDGSEGLDYYYVLVGDKFGWVAKGGKNVTAQTDDKLEIINNNVSSEVQFNAKFTSANAVHVYDLPLSGSNYTTFTQTLDDPQDAVVLQKFVETLSDGTTAEWYYVAYGNNQRGFVLTKNVGKFYASGSVDTEGTPVVGYKKINASLFEAVKLFATSDLDSAETLHDDAGEIKLYSGTMVVVVREEKGASFVEIRQNDGSTTYGWVKSANLIGTHDITTNAVVGITILSVAVVLLLVLVGVFKTRKKRRISEDSAE